MLNVTRYPNEPFIGLILDQRWTLRAPLGTGGMGQIYLATDEQLLSRRVVVKFLKDEAFQSDYLRKKFKHEMESLVKVQDPGVVEIYGAGTLQNGLPYIVMECVEGQSLQALLAQNGALPLAEVAGVVQQLAHTLRAVHQARIIHRDIKPSNIMLCRQESGLRVKLIDFGIARVKGSLVADSTVMSQSTGTLRYMSPEQLLGESAALTPASDVYSLALVAYEMLTGHRAFNATNAIQMNKLQEEGVRVMPRDVRPSISIAAQNILLKALQMDPAKRYQQAHEFGDALAQALTPGESGPFSQETRPAVLPNHLDVAHSQTNKARGNRALKAAAIVACLLALASALASGIWYLSKRAGVEKNVQASSLPRIPQPADKAAAREFSYSLLVTPMKNGQPLQKPFIASPSQTFLSGWQFRVLFKSQQDGFLYMLNEGSDEKGAKLLRILFPHPDFNNLSAAINSNQQVKTSASAFDSHPGIEKIWLVWSSREVPELERVKRLVNEKDLGAIRDAQQSSAIQNFLEQHRETKPLREEDKATSSLRVKSSDDVLIEFAELYHN